MYTNEDLQIFVDLSQTLSFSQTARNLHLSQSTVSKRIKDLETALQVILIERGQGMKSLRLTLAGETFGKRTLAVVFYDCLSEQPEYPGNPNDSGLSARTCAGDTSAGDDLSFGIDL